MSSEKNEIHKDRLSDGMTNQDVEEYAVSLMWEKKTIPFEFIEDYRLMRAAIHELTEYEHHKSNADNNIEYANSFDFVAFKLFNEALVQMLTEDSTTIKGAIESNTNIYYRIIEYVRIESDYLQFTRKYYL